MPIDRDAGVTSNLTADSSNKVQTSKKDDVGNGKSKLKSSKVKDIISKGRTMTGSRPDEININPVQEAAEKTAVMTFGRFNPITIGHEKLIRKVESTAKATGGTAHIIASHSSGDAKNPLKSDQKVEYLKKVAHKDTNVSASSPNAPSLLHHAAKLHAAGYKHLVMVAGGDRAPQYHEILNKYNGIESKHGHFNFKSIKVVSAGDRDPDAEGAEGMSGTKMRAFAREGNHAAFKKGLPKALHPHAKEIMNHIRSVTEQASIMEEWASVCKQVSYISTRALNNIMEKAINFELELHELLEQYDNAYALYNLAPDNLTSEQYAFNAVNSYIANTVMEKRGLWDNIHAKRERIKRGSGERMRKPGSEGAPTKADFIRSQVKEDAPANSISGVRGIGNVTGNPLVDDELSNYVQQNISDADTQNNIMNKLLKANHTKIHRMFGEETNKKGLLESTDRSAFIYMEPKAPKEIFAQCGSCAHFMPESERCTLFGKDDKVIAEASCGLYAHGIPSDEQEIVEAVSPKEAGYVLGQVRCENCSWYNEGPSTCGLFEDLNKKMADTFELKEKVDKYGCCNGFDRKEQQMSEDVNSLFEKEFKASDREAVVRDTPSGLRTFKFVKREGERKKDSEMYRQQAMQKQRVDEGTTTADMPEYQGKMASERKDKKAPEPRMAKRARKMNFVYKPVVNEQDEQEYDYEGDMAMSDLRSIMHNAQRIHDLLEPNSNLPEWCQSKITLAEDYISTVANYMTANKENVKEEAGCPLLDEDMEIEELIEEDFIPTGLELYEDWGELEEEAEKGGRKVKLGKPFLTPGGPKKRAVYVKNDKGNVVKVNFGDPNMRIKKSDPDRRRSFRARHNCDNPGPRHKARYWSCKAW